MPRSAYPIRSQAIFFLFESSLLVSTLHSYFLQLILVFVLHCPALSLGLKPPQIQETEFKVLSCPTQKNDIVQWTYLPSQNSACKKKDRNEKVLLLMSSEIMNSFPYFYVTKNTAKMVLQNSVFQLVLEGISHLLIHFTSHLKCGQNLLN